MNWTGSANNANAGTGEYGSCCNQMDIWEANSICSLYTPCVLCQWPNSLQRHRLRCGDGRYDGICDKDGCDFNSYRIDNTSFYGKGMVVDTSSKFTIVT